MAVSLLIKYIVKYQNNFISSYLFLKNLPNFMEKGICIHDLLDSGVFNVTFDYDYWPANHNNDEICRRAFNGSFFDIRKSYDIIFPDIKPMDLSNKLVKDDEGNDVHVVEKKKKISKIIYSINLLAQIGMHVVEQDGEIQFINKDISLMNYCKDTEELAIF